MVVTPHATTSFQFFAGKRPARAMLITSDVVVLSGTEMRVQDASPQKNKVFTMFHPILVPHGITDIVDAPIKSIVVYGTVAPLMYHLPLEVKASALVVGSLYHMRRDVPGLPANICIHALWIWQPWFAEAYLTWIHTPRHYRRTLTTKTMPKLLCIACMTLLTVVGETYTITWKPLWWVGFVLSHVIVSR